MRFFVVDLPSLFQRAIASGMQNSGPVAVLGACLSDSGCRLVRDRYVGESLHAVSELDASTLWPTRRIRGHFYGQPSTPAQPRLARRR